MAFGDNYTFIDGAYLRQRHGDTVPHWIGGPAELSMDKIRSATGAYKCFYYDCADIRRSGEDESAFNKRLAKQERLFDKFRRSYGTHVKLGSLVGEGKKARQKQVDILLAVDMMSHAARGNLRGAVLIAGDQDFKPLVDSLVSLGVFVEVWGDRRSTSPALVDAADAYKPLSFQTYFDWTEPSQTCKGRLGHVLDPLDRSKFQEQKKGTVGGRPATLFQSPDAYAVEFETPEGICCTAHSDASRVLLYCELEIGPVVGLNPT